MNKIYGLEEIDKARTTQKLSTDEIRIRIPDRRKGWAICYNTMGMWFVDDFDTEKEIEQKYNELKASKYWMSISDIIVHCAWTNSKWSIAYMIVE
jgi:hypothetical protein